MFRKSMLPLLPVLLFTAACDKQDEPAAAAKEEAAAQAPVVVTPQAEATVTQPEPAVEVSETEMIEMVGYLSAQRGGVAGLKLDQAGIAAMADGVQQGLNDTMKIEEIDSAVVQAAFSQVQARDMAARSGAEALPAIDADSLRLLGAGLVSQTGLGQLGFGADEAAMIAKGFVAGANDTETDPAIIAKMPAFQSYMQERVATARAAAAVEAQAAAVENIAAGKAFLADLAATDPDVKVTESGLHYKVLDPGTGEKPAMTDSVLVHYKGTLIDGTQFDSSYDRGAPATFRLNGVVKGFGEGLTKVGAGGKLILYMPSDLGYGNSPRPGGKIKPGDALVFECELLEVNPG